MHASVFHKPSYPFRGTEISNPASINMAIMNNKTMRKMLSIDILDSPLMQKGKTIY